MKPRQFWAGEGMAVLNLERFRDRGFELTLTSVDGVIWCHS